MYKITVLVSIYKGARYIDSKIQSLIQQTIFNEAQIVLLNCQNLENEKELYQDFLKYPNVIEITYNSYETLYKTWNDGIRLTDSKYITNSNLDDQWHNTYLERCSQYLDEHSDVAIVSTGVKITDQANQVWPNWKHHDVMPKHIYPLSSAGPSPMWRRSLHDKYGYFGDYYVIGDARFWEALHANNEKFELIHDDLVLYYIHPESLERRADENTQTLLRDLDLLK